MAICHIAILLLQTGKATEGDRIHSRLRYLAITLFNLAEVIMFGAVVALALKNLTGRNIFATNLSSRTEILYHCFKLTMLNITATPPPVSTFGYFMHVFLVGLGMELIVVVLAIILTVKAEDEAFLYHEPSLQEYWSWRASRFERSPWASDVSFLKRITQLILKRNVETVIDVGCGPGLLTQELSRNGLQVMGIDTSEEMLNIAKKYSSESIKYIQESASAIPVTDGNYDAVVMRMVLHNLPEWRQAILDAYRVLKEGGVLLIVEGFPPSEDCIQFFRSILSKVHKREYFTESVLKHAIEEAGFVVTMSSDYVIHQVSVVAWLESAVPVPKLRKELLSQHLKMSAPCRRAYNATKKNGDCLVDLRFLIITCEKPQDKQHSGTS